MQGEDLPSTTFGEYKSGAGFTLIELLIVVGITVVLATTVLLTLNPAELLKQGRDAKRISEINSIDGAIEFALSQSLNLQVGNPNVIYLSLPDSSASCSSYTDLPILEGGWSYYCAPETDYRKIDGTGWLPANFSGLPGGSPFVALPVDPINDASRGFYYAYASGGSWELNVEMESEKFSYGGSASIESKDGGNTMIIYETGTDLSLMPKEVSGRAGKLVRIPEGCADSDTSSGYLTFFTDWTIPGSGQGVVFKLWYWPRTENFSGQSVDMALYEGGEGGAKLSEVVTVDGDGTNWVSENLNSPVPITLGDTYSVAFGNTADYKLAYHDPPIGTCFGGEPNNPSHIGVSGGFPPSVPPDADLSRYGIFGVTYAER